MYWLVVLPFTYSYDINLQNGNYDMKNFRPTLIMSKQINKLLYQKLYYPVSVNLYMTNDIVYKLIMFSYYCISNVILIVKLIYNFIT